MPTEIAQGAGEGLFADANAWPQARKQLGSRHGSLPVLNQVEQHIQRLALDLDGHPAATEFIRGTIQLELSENPPRQKLDLRARCLTRGS